jgi:hypothetical protein
MFNFFRKKKPELVLRVVEEWYGNYHYHLTYDGKKALCGKTEIMERKIQLSSWGYKVEHLPMSYCKECERIWKGE